MRNKTGPVDDVFGTFSPKALQLEDAVSLLAAQNPVHPLIEWLENDVPKWDRIERLACLMEDTFTIKDTADTPDDDQDDENWMLAQWGSVYILLGTIQRSYEAGCKLDEMLVIIGPPGIGKSTLLRHLLPPHLQTLFSDGLDLGADAKERVEALQGRCNRGDRRDGGRPPGGPRIASRRFSRASTMGMSGSPIATIPNQCPGGLTSSVPPTARTLYPMMTTCGGLFP